MRVATPLRVLIADEYEVVREGLRLSLAADARIDAVAIVATGHEAVSGAKRLLPDVALVDLALPDLDGAEVCRRIRAVSGGRTRVVLTASATSSDRLRAAVDAGAFAYVPKAAGLRALRAALEQVITACATGAEPDPIPAVRSLLGALHEEARQSDRHGLSPHQRRVLELASEGLTDREIGRTLCVTESTVRYHVQRLKARFGARSKVDLVRRAYDAGLAGVGAGVGGGTAAGAHYSVPRGH